VTSEIFGETTSEAPTSSATLSASDRDAAHLHKKQATSSGLETTDALRGSCMKVLDEIGVTGRQPEENRRVETVGVALGLHRSTLRRSRGAHALGGAGRKWRSP
jgi:hypothetical protein